MVLIIVVAVMMMLIRNSIFKMPPLKVKEVLIQSVLLFWLTGVTDHQI